MAALGSNLPIVHPAETQRIRIYDETRLHDGPTREVHLPVLVGLPGHYEFCPDRSPSPLGEDADEREQMAFDLCDRLRVIPGVASVQADKYKLRVEFGTCFDPNDIMPNVLTVVIHTLGFKKVSLSEWHHNGRLALGHMQVTPGFHFEFEGVEVVWEQPDGQTYPREDNQPQGHYLLVEHGGILHHLSLVEIDPELLRLLFDPAIPQPVVVGYQRCLDQSDKAVSNAIARCVLGKPLK